MVALTLVVFLKAETNMNWSWTSRDFGRSFGRPTLKRFEFYAISVWVLLRSG